MTQYATITAKGQLTIPVEFRRALKLIEGQKVALALEGDQIILKSPGNIDAVRTLLRQEMERKGTLKVADKNGDGWAAHIAEDYGESRH